MNRIVTSLLILLLALLIGCSEDSTAPDPLEQPFEPTAPVNPQPAENRIFGVTVSESSNGFQADFLVAQQAGIQAAELALPWDAVEVADGVYQDPDGVLAATAFYAANNIKVMLTFAVINTNQRTTPDHLDQYDWNAPELITAFNNMADFVLDQLPDEVLVVGVAIGNEVNYVLEGDEWTQYGEFLFATREHLHDGNADLNVGVKTTVSDGLFGLHGNHIQTLNENTDVVMLNYYLMDQYYHVRPPFTMHNDFTNMASQFPGRELWLTEVGYQSGSEFCQSNEDMQASFYHELFTAWDTHRHTFDYLMIDWLHDASPAQLAEWEDYYGSSDPAFLGFLGTLGLRTNNGKDKNAWLQLLAETGPRGWLPPPPITGK